jgi:hypothetical protein
MGGDDAIERRAGIRARNPNTHRGTDWHQRNIKNVLSLSTSDREA